MLHSIKNMLIKFQENIVDLKILHNGVRTHRPITDKL